MKPIEIKTTTKPLGGNVAKPPTTKPVEKLTAKKGGIAVKVTSEPLKGNIAKPPSILGTPSNNKKKSRTLTSNYNANKKMLKKNVQRAKGVINRAYEQSVKEVDKVAGDAKKASDGMAKASAKRLGKITGTSKNKLDVAYGSNVSKINASQASAKDSLNQARKEKVRDAMAQYNTDRAKTIDKYINDKQTQKKENEKIKRETRNRNLEIYNSTISRFDSVDACDKAINKLKKSNSPNKKEKIAYIRQQRAKLISDARSKLLTEKGSKSGRSGSGWHSWGRGGWRRYGNGSGSSEGEFEVESKAKEGYFNPNSNMGEYLSSGEYTVSKPNNKNNKKSSKESSGHVNPVIGDTGTKKKTYKKKYTGSVARSRNNARRHGHW